LHRPTGGRTRALLVYAVVLASLSALLPSPVSAAPAPTITSLSPSSGPAAGGTSVTITGTDLAGATDVSFGANPATDFTVVDATQITATSPAGSAVVEVVVTTADGSSAPSVDDNFTYVAAPAVSSVTPDSGPAGGGTSVTIAGTDLTGASAVNFGATPATTFSVDDATHITATSPAGSDTVHVRVTTPGGTSAAVSADSFTYIGPPTVTSVSPNAGPLGGGTSVTVTGTDFIGATAVSFGATPATTFTVGIATKITATSPAGSGTADVTVTTPSGTSATSASDQFTYTPLPTVTSVAPGSGPATGGTSVTINGTDFAGATDVSFGANAATFTVDNATRITATSPAGSGTVHVTVTTAGGTTATSVDDTFTYIEAPTVSSVSPSVGPDAGGTSVTIAGENFTGATAVTFGSTDATSFTIDDDTQITATSPAGAGTVHVTVTTGAGTSATSSADQFTYVGVPAIESVLPASGPSAGGTSVTITGTNFTGATSITFGANNATSYTVDSSTQITAITPAGSGTVEVTVITAGGTSDSSDPDPLFGDDDFTYVEPPTVSAVSPSNGPTAGGTSVTITGSNLTDATGVSFGANAATTFTVDNDTQITATSPAGSAGAVDVKVTTVGGTSATSVADNFTYLAAPTVSAVSPDTGPATGGTSVTITGTDLTGASGVSFGGTPGTFTVDSSTQITATSPAGSGIVDVTVTTGGGTSAPTAADQFTYVGAPTITSVSPAGGPTGGGTSVSITGTDFDGATGVSFGATAATAFIVDNATQITATSPAGSAGMVHVTVTTTGGTSGTTSSDQFLYVAAPAVTSVSPPRGPTAGGTSVVITGTNLTGATAVSFGADAATTFTVDSATQITATSPSGSVGTVDVTVTTVGGTSATSGADEFTYVAAPTITSVTPATGPAGGGTSVTIAGTNLTGATAVSFGANAATTFTVDSSAQITATSPAGSGTVDVTVTTAGGTSATGAFDSFIYIPRPAVTSVAPRGGPATGGTSVTITGTNLNGAAEVKFGDTDAADFIVDSPTQITATSPAGAGLVDITVTTPGGTSATAAADGFTYSDRCVTALVDAAGASSTVIGRVVHFVASSTGCPNPTYKFLLKRPGAAWKVVRAFGSNLWDWNTKGLAAGTYRVRVWANESGHSTAAAEAIDEIEFKLNSAAGSCTTALLSYTGPSSRPAGADVNFTATSAGCSSPMYEFWVGSGGKWTLTRTFSSTPTWTWHSTGKAPGIYEVHVWANQKGHSTSAWESVGSATVTLTGCASATIDPITTSGLAGSTIVLTADSGGCPNPWYEFWVQYLDGSWHLIQGFGGATFNWNTGGLAPGSYEVHVWANQQGASTKAYEVVGVSTVTLTGCTSVSLDPNPATGQAGSTVVLTASAAGCPAPKYEFWVQYLDGTWHMIQGFGGATFNWSTKGLAPGSYEVHVWANQQGASTATWQANGAGTVILTGCTSATITSSSPTTPRGGSVTFTAHSAGCTNAVYELWVLRPGTSWRILISFSSASSWTINVPINAKTGSYTIHVWANTKDSSYKAYQAVGSVSGTIT
jgi:hypothetical protein